MAQGLRGFPERACLFGVRTIRLVHICSGWIAALVLLAKPAMAEAGGSTPLPEPSSTVLLALGIAGLLVGRRFARKGSED